MKAIPRNAPWYFLLLLAILLVVGRVVLAREQGGVTPTNQWVDIYSTHSTFAGQPLTVGDAVAVFDSQGTQCGEFTVHTAGWYGLMPCYGDDPDTPGDEGAVAGDALHFTINGMAAQTTAITHNGVPIVADTVIIWNQHGERWQVDLNVAATGTPTSTSTDTPAPSRTPTLTPTPSRTPTLTSTPSRTPTFTPTPSRTPTFTPTPSRTPTFTPTLTPTPQPVWRFRGTTYRGLFGDKSSPIPNVFVRLYGRQSSETAPGTWLQTTISTDPEGFWSFYELRPYDYYRVVAQVPSGMVATGAWSADGAILSATTIEWFRPAARIHLNEFYFVFPTTTPTPTLTSTPSITPTPSPTPTGTPTATPSPTSSPTASPSPTPTPTPAQTQVLDIVAVGLSSGIAIKWHTGHEPPDIYFVVERQETSAQSGNGSFVPVSPEILGKGSDSTYSYLDASARQGVTYYYRLRILPAGQISTLVVSMRWWELCLPLFWR